MVGRAPGATCLPASKAVGVAGSAAPKWYQLFSPLSDILSLLASNIMTPLAITSANILMKKYKVVSDARTI